VIKVVKNVSEMSSLASQWSFDAHTALVPTMGALHEGHLALVRAAREHAERVIVSIFVNPLQFGPAEDFNRYPRTLDQDTTLLAEAGADLVFAPAPDDMTPPGMLFSVDPGPMADVLCGHYRPGHFTGVCTIVTKLFQVARPGHAYFGWKDAQQFLILRRMVEELNIPVTLQAVETIREADGLAMSSRNNYLTPELRAAAPAIFAALSALRREYEAGEQETEPLLSRLRCTI
jgi:pantoate--beta-alanine ligase